MAHNSNIHREIVSMTEGIVINTAVTIKAQPRQKHVR